MHCLQKCLTTASETLHWSVFIVCSLFASIESFLIGYPAAAKLFRSSERLILSKS